MYQLKVGSTTTPTFTFEDESLLSINRTNTVDLTSSKLEVDQFNTIVFHIAYTARTWCPRGYDLMVSSDEKLFCDSTPTKTSFDTVKYGTPVWFYKEGILIGKYYIKKIKREKRNEYLMECESPIGMLVDQYHYGGLYEGETFETVVTDIIGNQIPFSCENDVKSTAIFGHLPYATRRDNLHALMFATSTAITKDANGDVRFSYLYGNSPQTIEQNNIYVQGNTITYGGGASEVHLTEHAYAEADEEEITLFDNSSSGETADHTLVVFDKAPIYGFKVNTTSITIAQVPITVGSLTVNALGVNYAIVTGTGTMYGTPYTDITRVVKKSLTTTGEQKIVESDSCGLISSVNSDYVAERLLSYYSSSKTVKADVLLEEESTGLNVSFIDHYGENETGYIRKMEVTSDTIEKAKCEIITGYTPQGQGNQYTSFALLTGSGTWTIPQSVLSKTTPTIKAILIGGGNGGQSGGSGTSGGIGKIFSSNNEGGEGGSGGDSGDGGKILVETINVSGLTTLSFSCGSGGAGASATLSSHTPIDGEQGTATTLTAGSTTYSSANGATSVNGYKNLFTGQVYGRKGVTDAVNGGDGASGNSSDRGGDVVYKAKTYRGGNHGSNLTGISEYATGGGGSGAAVGMIGLPGTSALELQIQEITTWVAGTGGIGVTPYPKERTDATIYGQGGLGGHGGSGGGAGGCVRGIGHIKTIGLGGIGGLGGTGGSGANGCIIIYI